MKNTEFVEKAKNALNYKTIYAWGGFGNRVTISRIDQFAKRYPGYYSQGLINYLKANTDGYMVDCCGLIKSVFMGGIPNVEYNAKYDRDSDGITIGNATEVGTMNNLPEIEGILLQMDGHCGIYLGNGKVLESTPNEAIAKRKYGGVCISNLSDRKWLHWAKSKWIEYEEVKPVEITKTIDELAHEVIDGKWGSGKDRKNRLTQAGYDYNKVQDRVNEILSNKKSIDEIAKEVIQGKWGVGKDRKERLTKAGYNYDQVQKRVNELLS